MGEAKKKKSRQQALLAAHPHCIYCGDPANTVDHCPPRTFFSGRHWPETYDFPACAPCNSSARLDEQALAVLIRSGVTTSGNPADQAEWERLVQGVKNNQPAVVAEWQSISSNEVKHALRLAYGSEGDERRRQGWGVINQGALTQAMISRFMIKLSKALYYQHNHQILDGVVYVHHIDRLSRDTTSGYMKEILRMAPAVPKLERGGKSLFDQFIYRFNHSPEHRVMYAVVQFGEQFIFQLIAVSREMDRQLEASAPRDEPLSFRHECFLTP